MRESDVPAVPGVISADAIVQTGKSIAAEQENSGAVPWFSGGHTDPWDHVEAAMALSATGLIEEAVHAYEWLRRSQRADGSWPMRVFAGEVEDPGADTNFCAYPAVGVWHHLLITRDDRFAERMWPTVRAAIEFVVGLQRERGEIPWAVNADSEPAEEALLSGCSSIHHSLRCALALADYVGQPQPGWEVALGRLAHALRRHSEAFSPRHRYSMDWYYPVLGGALRGEAGRSRLFARWSDFVVEHLGVRCVDDRPWVTGAETCELTLTLDTVGESDRAREQLAAMQHLRDPDGSYWTGLAYDDGKRWPEERTTWTAAAVVLAADALSRTTNANGIFRGDTLPSLPTGFSVESAACCDSDSRVLKSRE